MVGRPRDDRITSVVSCRRGARGGSVADGAALGPRAAAHCGAGGLSGGVLTGDLEGRVVLLAAAAHPVGREAVRAGDLDLGPSFGAHGRDGTVVVDDDAAAGKGEGGEKCEQTVHGSSFRNGVVGSDADRVAVGAVQHDYAHGATTGDEAVQAGDDRSSLVADGVGRRVRGDGQVVGVAELVGDSLPDLLVGGRGADDLTNSRLDLGVGESGPATRAGFLLLEEGTEVVPGRIDRGLEEFDFDHVLIVRGFEFRDARGELFR